MVSKPNTRSHNNHERPPEQCLMVITLVSPCKPQCFDIIHWSISFMFGHRPALMSSTSISHSSILGCQNRCIWSLVWTPADHATLRVSSDQSLVSNSNSNHYCDSRVQNPIITLSSFVLPWFHAFSDFLSPSFSIAWLKFNKSAWLE